MADPDDRLFAALAPYISFDDSLRLRLVSRAFCFHCNHHGLPPPPFPWLMLPETASPTPLANAPRTFYNINIPGGCAYRYLVPGEASYRFVASAHGWIVFAAVKAPRSLVLVNPITQRRVDVEWPFGEDYIDGIHAVLTSSPLDPECILAVASDWIIAYCYPCRPWEGWGWLPAPGFRYAAAASDMVCVVAVVYLVDDWRMLWRVDLDDPDPEADYRYTWFSHPYEERARHHLVESLGLVYLVVSDEHHRHAMLYRMDWPGSAWVPADDWRIDRVLLLGRGCSAAVPAAAAPGMAPGTFLFAHQPSTAIDAGATGAVPPVRFWTEFIDTCDGLRLRPLPRPKGEFNAGDSFWFFPAIDPDEDQG